MQVFIFFYLHYFCLWVCGWVLSLGLRKMPYTHGMVNVSSVTTSPQLQGITMVGKCVGWQRTGFVSSQCCFLFTHGPWLCCVFESISTASTGLFLDEWLGSVWMSGAGELSLGFAGPPPLPAISMDTTVLFKVSQLPLLGSTKMGRWKGRCLFWGGTVLLPLTLQAVLWGLQPEFSTTTTFTGAKVDANCVHVYYPYFSPHSTSLTYPNIPTFKCTDAWILQARMCVEQGILCRVMVRLVNLREERKASSHSTIISAVELDKI